MPLINCKVELSLGWYKKCILSSAGNSAAFAITDAKRYVPIVSKRQCEIIKTIKQRI